MSQHVSINTKRRQQEINSSRKAFSNILQTSSQQHAQTGCQVEDPDDGLGGEGRVHRRRGGARVVVVGAHQLHGEGAEAAEGGQAAQERTEGGAQ